MRPALGVFALLLAAGCGERKGSGAPPMDTTMGMGLVHRHSEMPGMLMLPRMRAHLDSMSAADAAPGGPALEAHAALTRQMLETMERDRRDMELGADPAWSALADSVRRDVAGWTGPAAAPEPPAFRAHLERVGRLLALYQGLR